MQPFSAVESPGANPNSQACGLKADDSWTASKNHVRFGEQIASPYTTGLGAKRNGWSWPEAEVRFGERYALERTLHDRPLTTQLQPSERPVSDHMATEQLRDRARHMQGLEQRR